MRKTRRVKERKVVSSPVIRVIEDQSPLFTISMTSRCVVVVVMGNASKKRRKRVLFWRPEIARKKKKVIVIPRGRERKVREIRSSRPLAQLSFATMQVKIGEGSMIEMEGSRATGT